MEDMSVRIQESRAEEKGAREVLIERNLGLVRHVVKRFEGRGTDTEDLFQIGVIGLIKAVDHFDTSRGVMFSTYAVPLIMGEIRRFLREDGLVKISRTIRENAWKLAKVREAEELRLGRTPRLSELAEAARLSYEDALLALEAGGQTMSLEAETEAAEGEGVSLLDRISADTQAGCGYAALSPRETDAEKERLVDHLCLQQLLGSLEQDERRLIWLRFFQNQTQEEASKVLGISQVQVSRREKKILSKLRLSFLGKMK